MNMKIVVSNTIEKPISKVWEYYNSPEHIVNWNFATEDWQCPWAENDMKVGGVYKAKMEAKDGSFGFELKAVYSEIIPEKSFVYILEDKREVSVKFLEKGQATFVEISFDAEQQNPAEMQKAGWQAILDNFKKYAEKQ